MIAFSSKQQRIWKNTDSKLISNSPLGLSNVFVFLIEINTPLLDRLASFRILQNYDKRLYYMMIVSKILHIIRRILKFFLIFFQIIEMLNLEYGEEY